MSELIESIVELIIFGVILIFMAIVCWETFLALFLWLKVPIMISKGLSLISTYVVLNLGKSCKND